MLQDIHINYFLSAPDVNFFCASNQKPLGPSRNTRGSLWAMFSEVTGVECATPNTVRRGLETTVQSSPRYAARSTDIQGHSLQVGTEYYHRTADEVRFLCIYNQARKEIPTEQVQDDDSDNEVENDGDDFSTPSKRQKPSPMMARCRGLRPELTLAFVRIVKSSHSFNLLMIMRHMSFLP